MKRMKEKEKRDGERKKTLRILNVAVVQPIYWTKGVVILTLGLSMCIKMLW